MGLKTRFNKKRTVKNKTRKITLNKKTNFVKKILKEWTRQTNGGNVAIDDTKYNPDYSYNNDYYLSIGKKPDRDNHIHLVLKDFGASRNLQNNILYVMKKMDLETNEISHSGEFNISIHADEKQIVKKMIHAYLRFNPDITK